MDSSKNGLFSDEESQILSTNVNDIDAKASLFGLTNKVKAPLTNLGSTSHNSDSLQSNLAHSSSEQINRLIQLKYGNDPTVLIKQLSMELANMQTELLVQRQRSFLKEQKLYKLCNEYANLSTLEIDRLLLKIDETQLDIVKSKQHTNPPETPAIPDESSKSSSNESSDADMLLKTSTSNIEKKNTPSNLIIPGWIKNISRFGSSDELHHRSPQPTLLQRTKSFPMRWMAEQNTGSTIDKRVPVELEPLPKSTDPAQEGYPHNSDIDVDKYGFFIDINSPHKHESNLETDKKASGSLQAILINDKKSYLQSIEHLIEITKIHDSTTQSYERQWELLMKDINKYRYKNNHGSIINFRALTQPMHTNTDDVLERFGVQGLNLLKYNHGEFYNQMVYLIHKVGIPEKYRCELWLELSGANDLRVNGEYLQLVNDIDNYMSNDDPVIQENIKQIDLDLTRTLRSNYFFNNIPQIKSGPNFFKLERILYAFVAFKPDIGYCQGMNKIVGNLLILMSYHNSTSSSKMFTEEDIFWIFIGLIEEILPRYNKSFFNGLIEIRQDQLITHDVYFAKYLPELHKRFTELGVQFEVITINWWLTLFLDLRFITLDTWFKVFDMLLIVDTVPHQDLTEWKENVDNEEFDASKLVKLICITLSILQCLQPFLSSMHDKSTIYRFLDGNTTSKIYDENHNEMKVTIKFSDLIDHYQKFLKKLDGGDLVKYRAQYSERENPNSTSNS